MQKVGNSPALLSVSLKQFIVKFWDNTDVYERSESIEKRSERED